MVNIIINTFKEGGENYIDYEKKESVNIYDLYIPYSASKKRDKFNKIILLIHGGSWINGKKQEMDKYVKNMLNMGL